MFKAIAESRTSLLSLVTSAPVADPLPASQTSSPGSAFSSRARQGDAAQLTPQSTPPHTAPVRPQDHLHLHRRPLCRRRQPDAQDSPRARGVRPLPLPFLLSLSLSLSLQPLIRNPTRRQRRTVSRPQARRRRRAPDMRAQADYRSRKFLSGPSFLPASLHNRAPRLTQRRPRTTRMRRAQLLPARLVPRPVPHPLAHLLARARPHPRAGGPRHPPGAGASSPPLPLARFCFPGVGALTRETGRGGTSRRARAAPRRSASPTRPSAWATRTRRRSSPRWSTRSRTRFSSSYPGLQMRREKGEGRRQSGRDGREGAGRGEGGGAEQ